MDRRASDLTGVGKWQTFYGPEPSDERARRGGAYDRGGGRWAHTRAHFEEFFTNYYLRMEKCIGGNSCNNPLPPTTREEETLEVELRVFKYRKWYRRGE